MMERWFEMTGSRKFNLIQKIMGLRNVRSANDGGGVQQTGMWACCMYDSLIAKVEFHDESGRPAFLP